MRAVQTALDRTVLVHRVQFETEFAALKDIWAKVAALRAKMGLVRPIGDIVPRGETPEQRAEREHQRFQDFHEAFIEALQAVDSQSPFIPRDIYQKLEEVIQVARNETIEVRLEGGDRDRNELRDWHQRGREHFQALCRDSEEVSDLIRARLERLTVVPAER